MVEGMRMEEVEVPRKEQLRQIRIWTDAKATEEKAWIGGWLEESSELKECRWFAMEVKEDLAPCLRCRKGDPKRVIAALEMLGTLVAMKLWAGAGAGEFDDVKTKAFTDNQGNQYIVQKGMSTKFPLTLLMMEMSEELRAKKVSATLEWVRRDENQAADDLTNMEFGKFDSSKRCTLSSEEMRWRVLDGLMSQSQLLYEEIEMRKREKKLEKTAAPKRGRKPGKFFNRWATWLKVRGIHDRNALGWWGCIHLREKCVFSCCVHSLKTHTWTHSWLVMTEFMFMFSRRGLLCFPTPPPTTNLRQVSQSHWDGESMTETLSVMAAGESMTETLSVMAAGEVASLSVMAAGEVCVHLREKCVFVAVCIPWKLIHEQHTSCARQTSCTRDPHREILRKWSYKILMQRSWHRDMHKRSAYRGLAQVVLLDPAKKILARTSCTRDPHRPLLHVLLQDPAEEILTQTSCTRDSYTEILHKRSYRTLMQRFGHRELV